MLVDTLLGRISRQANRLFHLSGEALAFLLEYDYPGNIRELRNILQVAASYAMRTRTGEISLEAVRQGLAMRGGIEQSSVPQAVAARRASSNTNRHGTPATSPGQLPPSAAVPPGPHGQASSSAEYSGTLKAVEARHIAELLARYSGNRRQVAQALGVRERTLYRKLKRFGMSGN